MTPQEYRDAAVQALDDVNDCPESPSQQRVLTQAAIAYAVLGLLEIQIASREPPGVDELLKRVNEGVMTTEQANTAMGCRPTDGADRSVCGECGETIYQHIGQPWKHVETQMPDCYRDPKDAETAYPDPQFATERI